MIYCNYTERRIIGQLGQKYQTNVIKLSLIL